MDRTGDDAAQTVERAIELVNTDAPPRAPYDLEHGWVVNCDGEALEFEGEPVDVGFLLDGVSGPVSPEACAHVLLSYIIYAERGGFLPARL